MPLEERIDLITVRPTGPVPHRGVVLAAGTAIPCAIGRAGITKIKREGDGASPAGTWPLRIVLYRSDRLEPPATGLPVRALSPRDGWCDCPDDPQYNRLVALPHPASAEALWRDDRLYDIVVVLGYNDDPPRAGLGSAIFFHLATTQLDATAGCVAVSRADMERLLARCGPDTRLKISP